jgi:multiple sugar transport system substrate-binding protein
MEMTNSLPATQKSWDDESLKGNEYYKAFGEQMKASQPMPVIKQWEEIAQTYLKSFEKIYRGQSDVQDEMDDFQKKSEKILSK